MAPFLNNGITLAGFSCSGTHPVDMDQLNACVKCSPMMSTLNLITLGPISSGPGDLPFLNLAISNLISLESTGKQNKLFLIGALQ